MINANELRIGNYATGVFGEEAPFKIMKGFQIDDFNDIYFPIPLTSEILEKCLQFNNGMKHVFTISIESEYGQAEIQFWDGKMFLKDIDDGTIGIEIKYLHQLQNLYFALAGEELEINL